MWRGQLISVNRSFRACWDASAGRRRVDPGSWGHRGVHQPQEDDRITAGQLLTLAGVEDR